MRRTLVDIAAIAVFAFLAALWPGAFFLLGAGGLFLWLCWLAARSLWAIGRG